MREIDCICHYFQDMIVNLKNFQWDMAVFVALGERGRMYYTREDFNKKGIDDVDGIKDLLDQPVLIKNPFFRLVRIVDVRKFDRGDFTTKMKFDLNMKNELCLPDDLFFRIFEFLDVTTVFNSVSLVCKKFHVMINSDLFLKPLKNNSEYGDPKNCLVEKSGHKNHLVANFSFKKIMENLSEGQFCVYKREEKDQFDFAVSLHREDTMECLTKDRLNNGLRLSRRILRAGLLDYEYKMWYGRKGDRRENGKTVKLKII